MKIALMTNNYKPFVAGVPISIERLKRGLINLGHQVTVFAPTYDEQEYEEGCFRYSSITRKFIGGVVLPNPLDKRIEQEFRKGQYDIIHVHHPMLIGKTAVHLSKKYNIPLTFTYHTRYEQYLSYVKGIRVLEQGAAYGKGRSSHMKKRLLYKIRENLVPAYLQSFFSHCHHVFVPTAGMQEYLISHSNLEPGQIDILPTGIEAHHYQVTAEESDSVRERYHARNIPLFLTVARMSHEKNIQFLIESIAGFKKCFQKPFRVLMVGDRPDRLVYEEMCRQLNIEEEVVFTGKIPNEEIAPYYKAADAFLFASKTETQGIVIAEAFAGATPVIALNASGISDLMVNGYNGYLCPEDMDIFINTIMDFLLYSDKREALAAGALETAANYREEAVALRAGSIYNRVIGEFHDTECKKQRMPQLRLLT